MIGSEQLTIDDIDGVARRSAVAAVHADARPRLERAYAFVRSLADRQVPVYGLTTGCGPLAGYGIPPARREEFQRNLIRSHAVTLGDAHPASFVRAAMLVRAHVFTH